MIYHDFVTIRTLLNKVLWFPTHISNGAWIGYP